MTRLKQMFVVMAGVVLVAAGPDNDPASYKVRLPLTLAGDVPVQRVDVPVQALIALQNTDVTDLRIFDGRGRVVPIARMPATSIATRRIVLQALPILGSQDALEVSGVSLKLDDQGRARVVSVDGRVADDRTAKVLGVLFDTRGIEGSAKRLTLDVVMPAGQPVTFRVEASEDLQNWRSLGERVIYRTPDGRNADGEAVALGGTLLRDTRLRVTWRAGSRLLSPVMVRSAALITQPDGAAAIATVGATISALTDSYTIEFAVPFATPLATIAVDPTGNEGLVPVRVLGRNHAEEPWTLLGRGAARPGGAAIALSGQSVRAMRIEADRRTDGFRATPTIRFGFSPTAIAFVASGQPPFMLAAGRADTRDVFLPLGSVRRSTDATLSEAKVRAPFLAQLTLQSVTDGGAPKRRIILWGVLLAATALLAGMAWRIGRATTERVSV